MKLSAKMQTGIFQLIQRQFDLSGICRGLNLLNWKNGTILIYLALSITSSALFFVLRATKFGDYCESFYFTATLLTIFTIIIEFTRKTSNVYELIGNFEKTIEKRVQNPACQPMYENVIAKIEKVSDILHFVMFKLSLPGAVLPNFIVSFFLYFTTDLGSKAFRLAFPIWLPFDLGEPIKFSIAFSIQFMQFFCIVIVAVPFICFIVGSCEILITFALDLKENLNAIKASYKVDNDPVKLKQEISEFIQFHSDANQFARDFSAIYNVSITAAFLWSSSTICGTLLMVQMELTLGNFVEVVRPLTLGIWSFFTIFLLCYCGERVSNEYEAIIDCLTDCDWYAFPIEEQGMMQLIILAAQQPVTFQGFGNIMLTRETFKKVVNGGFSYFMMLRQFNN